MMEELKVKTHSERPDLAGEHPWGDLGQLILFIVFVIVGICDFFFFDISELDYVKIPYWVLVVIASIVLIFGLYFARTSLKIIFGIKREKPEVVQEKIYQKVRHPMYLGAILFYLGVTILSFSLPLLFMCVIIFLFYDFIARHEEKLLVQNFGDEYVTYMKQVRRWLPKLK